MGFRSNRFAWISHNRRDVPDGLCILHSCIDSKSCCNPAHLRAGTQFENVQDTITQGRGGGAKISGEFNKNSKLTNEMVLEIRQKYSTGMFTYKNLAIMFNMNFTSIGDIVTGYTWKHLLPNQGADKRF